MTFFNLELTIEVIILTVITISIFSVIAGVIFLVFWCKREKSKIVEISQIPRIQEVCVIHVSEERNSGNVSTTDSCYIHCPSPNYRNEGEENGAFQFDENFINVIVTF